MTEVQRPGEPPPTSEPTNIGDQWSPEVSDGVRDHPVTKSATIGDQAIIPNELRLDLGILRTRASEKTVVFELARDSAAEVLQRLIGGRIVLCHTCKAPGQNVRMPEPLLQQHDLTVHAEYWRRGRLLAEKEAVEAYEKAHPHAKAFRPGQTGATP